MRVSPIGRRTPYTAIGIRRVPCARCGQPSRYQWSVCALNNRFLGVCEACDVALNLKVLTFMGIPGTRRLIDAYRRRHRSA